MSPAIASHNQTHASAARSSTWVSLESVRAAVARRSGSRRWRIAIGATRARLPLPVLVSSLP